MIFTQLATLLSGTYFGRRPFYLSPNRIESTIKIKCCPLLRRETDRINGNLDQAISVVYNTYGLNNYLENTKPSHESTTPFQAPPM